MHYFLSLKPLENPLKESVVVGAWYAGGGHRLGPGFADEGEAVVDSATPFPQTPGTPTCLGLMVQPIGQGIRPTKGEHGANAARDRDHS